MTYVYPTRGADPRHEGNYPEATARGEDGWQIAQDMPKAVEDLVRRSLKHWQERVFKPEQVAQEAYRIMVKQLVRARERLGR